MTRRAPEPTSKDVSAWRRLLEEARRCANNPGRPTGDLFARTCSTARKVTPTGALTRDNPWIALRDTAIRYCADKAGRRQSAAELLKHAKACAALLDQGEPKPTRFRADVDG